MAYTTHKEEETAAFGEMASADTQQEILSLGDGPSASAADDSQDDAAPGSIAFGNGPSASAAGNSQDDATPGFIAFGDGPSVSTTSNSQNDAVQELFAFGEGPPPNNVVGDVEGARAALVTIDNKIGDLESQLKVARAEKARLQQRLEGEERRLEPRSSGDGIRPAQNAPVISGNGSLFGNGGATTADASRPVPHAPFFEGIPSSPAGSEPRIGGLGDFIGGSSDDASNASSLSDGETSSATESDPREGIECWVQDPIEKIRRVKRITNKEVFLSMPMKKCMDLLKEAKEGGFQKNEFFTGMDGFYDSDGPVKLNLNFGENSVQGKKHEKQWRNRAYWAFYRDYLYPGQPAFAQPWKQAKRKKPARN